MNGLKAIILNGKVYEAVLKGLRYCSDCDLYKQCESNARACDTARACAAFGRDCYIFRFSQELTDKINEK